MQFVIDHYKTTSYHQMGDVLGRDKKELRNLCRALAVRMKVEPKKEVVPPRRRFTPGAREALGIY